MAEALAPFERAEGENPYTVHHELQQTMQDLVGLIRREHEVRDALAALEKFKERAATVAVPGERAYNPGWHYAPGPAEHAARRRVRGDGRPGARRSPAAGTPARTTR